MLAQRVLGGLRHIVAQIAGVACSVILSRPVEGGLLLVNIFLFRSALRAFHRARFAATVRVIKDLHSDDVRYLLDQLPPWISDPQWERCAHLQSLLGLLWPAINTTVCAIIKRELEERVQESSDFGHIAFSRISFGKQVPVVAGIKAVPLQGEDLLAMVVDVDIRWAGEPDVVLALTKLGGATLGLSNVQLAGIVRLVFSPITEDPPFLRHMTVSLLNSPYVDFSVRALGGPDLMSLPAISSWLKTVVANLCDRVIVWPKEVHVPIAPRHRRPEEETVAQGITAPMGILVVRVGSAEIQPRRSTFLGRLKIPSPRLALIMPHPGSDGVAQVGLTAAIEKTLNPSWSQQFTFVVTRRDQHLRLLLSHKRMDLLATDMPLGAAEIVMEDVLSLNRTQMAKEAGASPTPVAARHGMAVPNTRERSHDPYNLPGSTESHDIFITPRVSRPSLTNLAYSNRRESTVDEADYESASSTPRQLSFSWASPSTSLKTTDLDMDSDDGRPFCISTRSRQQTVTWASASSSVVHIDVPPLSLHTAPLSLNHHHRHDGGRSDHLFDQRARHTVSGDGGGGGGGYNSNTNNSNYNNSTQREHHHPGLGAVLDEDKDYDPSRGWMPLQYTQDDTQNSKLDTATSPACMHANTESYGWFSPSGVWIQIPSTGSMTMAGMVSTAVEPRPPPASTPFAGADDQRGWLSSLQSFVLGSGHYGDVDSEEDDTLEEAMGATVGRVQVTLQWIPVTAARPVSPRTVRERLRQQRKNQRKGGRRSEDGVEEEKRKKIDASVCTADADSNDACSLQLGKRGASLDADNAAAAAGGGGGGASSNIRNNGRHSVGGINRLAVDAMDVAGNYKNSGIVLSPSGDLISQSSSTLSLSNSVNEAILREDVHLTTTRQLDAFGATNNDTTNNKTTIGSATALHGPLATFQEGPLSGVLVIRVSYTKVDYGPSPDNPMLALSIVANRSPSMSATAIAAADALRSRQRVVTMDCEPGARPGLITWRRTFYLPVWDASKCHARLELGNASSSIKLNSYGIDLYTLDACSDFDADVNLEAAATIPLKDVVARGVVRGTWRLRESSGGDGHVVEDDDAERLDVGRVGLIMSWHPSSSESSLTTCLKEGINR